MKKNCKVCFNEFDVKPSWFSKTLYCSRSCSGIGRRKAEEKNCERCNSAFTCVPSEVKKRRFCPACRKETFGKPVTKNCLVCDNPFSVKACKGSTAKFCSRVCANTGHAIKMNQGKGNAQIDKICLHCKKYFRGAENNKYCSHSCYWEHDKKDSYFDCEQCGKQYYRPPAHHTRENRHYCSKECFGLAERGQNNVSYVDGAYARFNRECPQCFEKFDSRSSSKFCNRCRQTFQKSRTSIFLRKHSSKPKPGYPPEFNYRLRQQVRWRDNFSCFLCGLTEREHKMRMHVHHIDHDKMNSSLSNLVSLCKHCHGKMHGSPQSRERWKKELSRLLEGSRLQQQPTT